MKTERITKEYLVYLYERYRGVAGTHQADLEVFPEVTPGQPGQPEFVVVNDSEPDEVATPLLLRAIDKANMSPGPYWEFEGVTEVAGHPVTAYAVVFKRLDVFGATDMWPVQCPNCGASCREFIDLRDEGYEAALHECVHDKEPNRGCGYRWIEEEGD